MDVAEGLSWAGCAFGLLGSYLLSNNNRTSGLGFAAYLVSNTGWIVYGLMSGNLALLLMQLGFTWTSVRGLVRWGVLKPRTRIPRAPAP